MENEKFLQNLKERLINEFNYYYTNSSNETRFYNQELNDKDRCGYTIYYGMVAHLKQTYRHNGTDENKSCEVELICWRGQTGRRLDRIKIKQDASEKQINNFVRKVVEKYNQLSLENK